MFMQSFFIIIIIIVICIRCMCFCANDYIAILPMLGIFFGLSALYNNIQYLPMTESQYNEHIKLIKDKYENAQRLKDQYIKEYNEKQEKYNEEVEYLHNFARSRINKCKVNKRNCDYY